MTVISEFLGVIPPGVLTETVNVPSEIVTGTDTWITEFETWAAEGVPTERVIVRFRITEIALSKSVPVIVITAPCETKRVESVAFTTEIIVGTQAFPQLPATTFPGSGALVSGVVEEMVIPVFGFNGAELSKSGINPPKLTVAVSLMTSK